MACKFPVGVISSIKETECQKKSNIKETAPFEKSRDTTVYFVKEKLVWKSEYARNSHNDESRAIYKPTEMKRLDSGSPN